MMATKAALAPAQAVALRVGLVVGGILGGLTAYRWRTQMEVTFGSNPLVQPPMVTTEAVVFMAGLFAALWLAGLCLVQRLMLVADQPPVSEVRYRVAVSGSIIASTALVTVGAALGVAAQVADDHAAVHPSVPAGVAAGYPWHPQEPSRAAT